MKHQILYKTILSTCIIGMFFSCKKETFTPVDTNSLNPDITASNTALDLWLKTTFLDEYNVNVIYHYNIYSHENYRSETPPDLATVMPTMTIVLDGFIKPYRKVAGVNFIKQNVPKEFVLFGSNSYIWPYNLAFGASASGGVRVSLFDLNSYSTAPAFATRRLGVIHNIFTHIVNQIFPMPADFGTITAAYYNADGVPEVTAHGYGFVSSYASRDVAEDFAEMGRSLLVSGQSWFDNWVNTSSAAGGVALRAKESSIVNYFNTLNIDYRALQKEVQLYIKDTVKDPAVTFPYWLNQSLYKTMTTNLEDGMYLTYGISADYALAYNQFKAAVLAFSTTNQFHLDYLQLMFTSSTTMTARMAYTAAGGTTQNLGDFDFTMAITPATGEIIFTKVANATGTTYNNGALFYTDFAASIQAYLTGKTFIGNWLPTNAPANMFTKTAGLYEKNKPSSYFYGPLTQ